MTIIQIEKEDILTERIWIIFYGCNGGQIKKIISSLVLMQLNENKPLEELIANNNRGDIQQTQRLC